MMKTELSIIQETKVCTNCENEKPLDEFSMDSRTTDKKQSWCKLCAKSNVTRIYNEDPELQRSKIKAIQDKYKSQGLCVFCGEARMKHSESFCTKCWLKNKAGSTLNDRSRWIELLTMLEKCKYRCHYTGIKLIPGVNLSFDHKEPRSQNPELIDDLKNIVPADWVVNSWKSATHYEDFVELLGDKKYKKRVVTKALQRKESAMCA